MKKIILICFLLPFLGLAKLDASYDLNTKVEFGFTLNDTIIEENSVDEILNIHNASIGNSLMNGTQVFDFCEYTITWTQPTRNTCDNTLNEDGILEIVFNDPINGEDLCCTNIVIRNWGTGEFIYCLLYTSPSPRDLSTSRMPSSA